LFYVSIKSKKIYYIDPLGSSDEDFNRITNNFIKFANSSIRLKTTQFTKVKLNHQIQQDSYNCGVFVCYFFEILITKNYALFNRCIDIQKYRTYIQKRLREFSNIKICCICQLQDKKENPFIRKFKPSLKVLKCKHKFHIDCLKQNSCTVCD